MPHQTSKFKNKNLNEIESNSSGDSGRDLWRGADRDSYQDEDEDEDVEAEESQALLHETQSESLNTLEKFRTEYPPTSTEEEEEDEEDGGEEGLRRRRVAEVQSRARREAYFGNLGIRSSLLKHSFFPIARIFFLSFLGVLAISWIAFSLSAFFTTSHSSSLPSSSNPPIDSSLLAKSLLNSAELSNGTHPWRKTVLLVSLDGVKPSYLTKQKMPNLFDLGLNSHTIHSTSTSSQAKVGSLLAESMVPIFPTLTFPNHWSLLTGLNSESHGIIGNNFYLPDNVTGDDTSLAGKNFYYTDPSRSWDPRWWKGQPIWASAERAGVPSAVLMWPGPPQTSQGDKPSFFQKYESDWKLKARNEKISEWLDKDLKDRPQLICAYVPDVDQMGHKLGPESVGSALSRVDLFISSLSDLINLRNLSRIIDIIVVSDHGMTSTSNDRLIYLDRILGKKLFSQVQAQDAWPNVGLHFKGNERTQEEGLELAEKILRKASTIEGGGDGRAFKVFRKNELPESWRWKKCNRLAELLLIPEIGWSFTNEEEMRIYSKDGVYQPLGNHGYSPSSGDMQAIFVSRGPSFKQQIPNSKGESNMKSFPNLEIYNLISHLLGIPEKSMAKTNGTNGFWDKYLSLT